MLDSSKEKYHKATMSLFSLKVIEENGNEGGQSLEEAKFFFFSSVHKMQYVVISLSLRNKPMEMFWLSNLCI